MTGWADPSKLLEAQRALRRRLLDRPNAIACRPGRELAAELLLRLDAPRECWQVSVDWLRLHLGVQRVDGGYASPTAPFYRLGQAEARADDVPVPSVREVSVSNREPALMGLWAASRPMVYADIAQDNRLSPRLRAGLLAVGTAAKIAVVLRERGTCFGLLCIDRVVKQDDWRPWHYECFDSVARDVLGPILRTAGPSEPIDTALDALTRAEHRVARLAAGGLTYKEIARALNRSPSTVDHQLRSIRHKLGARSTRRLVRLLADREVNRETSL